MGAHRNKCEATKQKESEADENFRELKRQGLLTVVEPVWKRRRFEPPEVCRDSASSVHLLIMMAATKSPENVYDPPEVNDNEMQEDLSGVSHIWIVVERIQC
jgi:hypothetical protein